MTKINRIFIMSFLTVILVVLGFYGWRLLRPSNQSSVGQKLLPKIADLDASNLPGKLFGPEKPNRALQLDNQKIIDWTNKYRAEQNLPALTNNPKLESAAKSKAQDMFAKQYFEHIAPDGKTQEQLILENGYNYKDAGENLALGDFDSEKALVDAWMASPGHRANILNADFKEIGVASVLSDYQGRTTWMSVQEFGRISNCKEPNRQALPTIDAKEAEFDNLSNTLTNISTEIQTLINQDNDKISQGNQIYSITKDKAKAQPYWDEGESFKLQAQAKMAQAKQIDQQLEELYLAIKNLVSEYNKQVNIYNECIK